MIMLIIVGVRDYELWVSRNLFRRPNLKCLNRLSRVNFSFRSMWTRRYTISIWKLCWDLDVFYWRNNRKGFILAFDVYVIKWNWLSVEKALNAQKFPHFQMICTEDSLKIWAFVGKKQTNKKTLRKLFDGAYASRISFYSFSSPLLLPPPRQLIH